MDKEKDTPGEPNNKGEKRKREGNETHAPKINNEGTLRDWTIDRETYNKRLKGYSDELRKRPEFKGTSKIPLFPFKGLLFWKLLQQS